MIKKVLPLALLGAAVIGNYGCKHESGGSDKMNGFDYKIIRDAHGKKANLGDIVEFHLIASIDTMDGKPIDTLGNSRVQNMGRPTVAKVDTSKRAGRWPAVFQKLGVGDSAVVYLSTDTLMMENPPMGQKMPPWLKPGKHITLSISVVGVSTEEDYRSKMKGRQDSMQKAMQDQMEAQKPIDEKLLQDYFAKNNLKPTKTETGLYYTISKEGSGEKPKAGQMVSMKYIGKTLDGKQFDANMDEQGNLIQKGDAKEPAKPLSFPVGQGRVIKGWDDGVMLLKKGAKATFYIPSALAYGPRSMGPDLPANSILVFNVEVVDIKDAPPAPEMRSMPQGAQGGMRSAPQGPPQQH